jgi:vancomycin resistance protein YoaR
MYRHLYKILAGLATIIIIVVAGYGVAFQGHILPNVFVGTLPLGGLTRAQALERVQSRLDDLRQHGILLDIEGKREFIRLESVNFSVSAEQVVENAWRWGRGSLSNRLMAWLSSPFASHHVRADVGVDREDVENELAALSEIIDNPCKDIRFHIVGTNVQVLYDTKPGRILDQEGSADLIMDAIHTLDARVITLALEDDVPRASRDSVPDAIQEAERIMRNPITLSDERYYASVDRATLGSWIISAYDGDRLVPVLDTRTISRYVTGIAQRTDVAPQKPRLTVLDGKVTDFIPPRAGRALEQDATVGMITDILIARQKGQTISSTLELPVKVTKAASEIAGYEGIVELIGKATTPFTGSPANRISNIKNGVKFLSGTLLAPGEEFSTLGTLGTIDNTTGYLPELVIKGDRTTPEFGGGLCQVSTTLFRSVLNAGLPVTARRNHSFRISYYEKDGAGKFIGPGLDATIYEPDLDFKFKNDTGMAMLVYGYVQGDRVTFELYGTSDGRTATVKGPTLFNEIPPGDPIYTETDTLPLGVTKQVEIPHPGGTTKATYTIVYPSGEKVVQDFVSYYRRWPARYLVGTQQ